MPEFSEVLKLLAQLKQEGVVADYAIGGAMAASIWDEVTATEDLDVAVVYANDPPILDPLRPILDRLPPENFPREGEHIMIFGVPVQFLPAWSPIAIEAVREAKDLPYDPEDPKSPCMRVMTATHLAALWQTDPGALTGKRRERIARFDEAGLLDKALLKKLTSDQP